jgi:iron-sulfur cluster repair protein YtfE (RIC family)
MLRNKSLIPLSRQHQHALALCVRIDRASPVADLETWQAEVELQFRSEIAIHFAAEEKVVFPAARRFGDLAALVEELLSEHAELRAMFAAAEAKRLSAGELSTFAARLASHIRKEERRLFERLQELLSEEEMGAMGRELDMALQEATRVCAMPSEIAKRPASEG